MRAIASSSYPGWTTAPWRMLPPALPEVLVQHVVDETPVGLEVLLDVLADRLDRARRSIRPGGGPRGPERDDHDPFLFLFRHGLTPSACSSATNASSDGG